MLERSTGGGLIVSYDIGLLGPERNGLEPVWPKNEYEKIVDIVPVGIVLFCFVFFSGSHHRH